MTCKRSQEYICDKKSSKYSHYWTYVILKFMKIWESGRESNLLDDIIAGRKTIEGRLNRRKFAEYSVGDIVSLRRDYRDAEGILRDGESHAAQVKVVAIRRYEKFIDMAKSENYKSVIPSANSPEEAAAIYDNYYSSEDQNEYGVLAIEVEHVADK